MLTALYLCNFVMAASTTFDVYDNDPLDGEQDPALEFVEVDQTEVEYVPVYMSSGSDAELTNVQVMSLNPITPDDATGLKAVMLELIGDYDAVVVEYEYTNSNGYNSYIREVQLDYVWLCSCGLFAIVIYCLFRLGGALLRD